MANPFQGSTFVAQFRNAMSRKLILYLVFFVLLFGGFYLVVNKWLAYGTNSDQKALIASFIIGDVQPFRFTDQDGHSFTNQDVKGKVYVAEYFFTTCPGICPKMNNNMKLVYEAFKDQPDFRILSHTCQPEVDSVPVLKKYADSLGVNKTWVFLTGRKDSLYRMARISYKIDDPNNNVASIEDDFLHTQNWALVNREGQVIAIYDGLKKAEVKDLISRIRSMLN